MKKKEIKETRSKSTADLYKLLQDERKKLQKLNFDLALGKVANVRDIRLSKKKVAQLLTMIGEKKNNKREL